MGENRNSSSSRIDPVPAPGYDQSATPRRFEFISFWGYLVFLVYCYLLYLPQDSLIAQPFDEKGLTTTGDAVPTC